MSLAEGAALAVENLRYRYPGAESERDAVDGLSFSIPRGKIVGIMGPNGSGKSTTFKILSMQLSPNEGDAWIEGHSVERAPAEARSSLGVTFQSPSLDPWLTIQENLEVQGRLFGLGHAEIRSRSNELLRLFGLTERREHRVKSLSGGLARRAELAKTLLSAPRVLLLDEPTTGLDIRSREDFWTELKKLRGAGLTIVVATHLLDEAEVCDELVILSEGKVVAQGTPDVLRAAGGRELVVAEGPGATAIAERLKPVLNPQDRIFSEPGRLRLETNEGSRWFEHLRGMASLGIENLRWGKPSLADVYFRLTGKSYA